MIFIRSMAETLRHEELQPGFVEFAFGLWWNGEVEWEVALLGA